MPDEDLKDISFDSKNDLEKIIRIIPLKRNSKYKDDTFELGILTIDVSNILDKNRSFIQNVYPFPAL